MKITEIITESLDTSATNTHECVAEEQLDEKWSQKYKDSINCSNPKGFSQKAHCAGKNKNEDINESTEQCPECGGPMFTDLILAEKKDACYNKVRSRYKVWPSAYASGALVQCRKKGAANWGNSKNEDVAEGSFDNASPMTKDSIKSDRIRSLKNLIAIAKEKGRQLRVQELELELKKLQGVAEDQLEENLRKWFKEKWVRFGPDGKIRGDCARGDDSEGKPKCLPQSKAHALGKKGRKYAASKKRREDPNADRKGKAINVATKKKKANEGREAPDWRVEQSDATGRYHVVTGYTDKSRKVWKNKMGAVDFVKKADAQAKADELNRGLAEVSQLNELSNDLLARYKAAAGKSASQADAEGDFDLGHKRFKGINKATMKQFDNDAKAAAKKKAEK